MNLFIGIFLLAIIGVLLLIHTVLTSMLACLYTIRHDMARICAELAFKKAEGVLATYPLGTVKGNTFTEKAGQERPTDKN